MEPQSKKVPGVILHILFASSALDPASTWLLINQILIIFFLNNILNEWHNYADL